MVFEGISNIGALLKQAQQMGGRMQELGNELKSRRAAGTSGGGMVEIEVNGLMEVVGCQIDEQLIKGGDRELIEDLVATAVNQAIIKGKQLHAEAMKSLTGGIEIPGLDDAMAKLLGGGEEPKQ